VALIDFLKSELAPTPGRTQAALRMALACAAATTIGMGLHMPHTSYALVTIPIVCQSDAGFSLRKGIQRLIGTIAGGAFGMLGAIATIDRPWALVPLVGGIAGGGLFLQRTTTVPYGSFLAAMTALIVLVTGETDPDAALATGFWRILVVALGIVLGTGAQLLLWPDDPQQRLRTQLRQRIEVVERVVRRWLAAGTAPTAAGAAGPPDLRTLILTGLTQQLDLLAGSELTHPSLRTRHSEQLALIAGVEQLLTAAAAFDQEAESLRDAVQSDAVRSRLATIAAACSRLRDGVGDGAPPIPPPQLPAAASDEAVTAAGGTVLLPSLVEMEHVLSQLSAPPTAGGSTDALRSSLDSADASGYLTPAFSLTNSADITAAVRTGLASSLCFIIISGLGWPALATSIWTCLVVEQTTLGASVQKALLRLAGAASGGVIGLLVITYAMPNMVDLPPLVVIVGLVTFFSGWINAGSPRISYAGIQITLAFALATLADLGPTNDLLPPRDRVLGVVLGIAVSAVLDFWYQPQRASTGMWRALATALRSLGGLARVGLVDVTPATRPVRGYRWQMYQNVSTALRMCDEASFEPGAGTPQARAQRAALQRLAGTAQAALLAVLALARHRLDVDLGRGRQQAIRHLHPLALAVADCFEVLAARLEGKPGAGPADLQPLLQRGVRGVDALAADPALDASTRAHLVARLALYRDVVARLEGLRADVEERRAMPDRGAARYRLAT
jgi:multidrug resistance protein MdtO